MRGNGAMQIGYMRISKGEQTTAHEARCVSESSCRKNLSRCDEWSQGDRPQFQAMLDFARPGDTIVVWRLDRLGRSLKHLIETVMGLQARGINFRSLVVSSDDQLQGPLLRSSELTAIIYWMYRAERRSSYIMTEHIDTSTPEGTFPSASQNRCGSTLEGITRQRAASANAV